MLDRKNPTWWKDAVIYEIYPKSFQDTGSDGIGDLRGIIERLDYISDLGADAIWLTPIYASPQRDDGYDISDYDLIDPSIGTTEEFGELVAQAKERGISVVMDLVLSCVSRDHPWFRKALKSRDNPYHDFFIWRDGTPDAPPNDMQAVFGGSAWTYVPELGQYYFGNYSRWQPDLNWENENLRRELYSMIRRWAFRGVTGFCLDAIENISKDLDNGVRENGPRQLEFIRELREYAFTGRPFLTIGEAAHATVDDVRHYADPDGSGLSMVVLPEAALGSPGENKWDAASFDLPAFKQALAKWQQGLSGAGWNALYLDSPNLPRAVSRWGDEGEYRRESAKMLATVMYLLQGTPIIYQGEELGMVNSRLRANELRDLESMNYYIRRVGRRADEDEVLEAIRAVGRDSGRTPMQWTDGPQAGFTIGSPWLPVNPDSERVNVAAEETDADSVLRYYRALLRKRRELPVVRDGSFTLLEPDNDKIFCYVRDSADESILVQANFTAEEQQAPLPEEFREAHVILHNYPEPKGPLRPYETRVLHRTKA